MGFPLVQKEEVRVHKHRSGRHINHRVCTNEAAAPARLELQSLPHSFAFAEVLCVIGSGICKSSHPVHYKRALSGVDGSMMH